MTIRSTEGTGTGSAPSGGTSAGGPAAARPAPVKATVKRVSAKPGSAKPASKPRTAKKPKTQHLTPCNKCGGEIFRSSFRHFGEVIIGPILLPFRCSRCGWRQFRSSFSRVRDKSNYRRATTDQ
jgi:hypothetical protein